MKKYFLSFVIFLFIFGCNDPLSPIFDKTVSTPEGVPNTNNTEYIQTGKTYLTLDSEIWNVEDGRYSFKTATIYGQIIDTVNHTPGPKLLYKDKFIHNKKNNCVKIIFFSF